jgi:hypothetical protein
MTPDVRDIITTFAADGRSPQETAEALSLYREDVYDSIKEEAGPNVRDAWAATEGLNADIQEGLDALRDSSILSFVDQKIPDPATQNEFWTQIKNEQPIDGRFGVTEQDLAGVTNDPTFRLKSDSTAPTNVDAGQRRLFSYQIRPRQNETFEALVSSPERGDMLLSFPDPKPEQIDEMAVKLEETRKQNARDVLSVDIQTGADYTDLTDRDVDILALLEGPSNLSAKDTAARRDAQQQLRLTMAKLAALRGPQGQDFARNELLVERMKQDDMVDFVGGRDVGNYLTDIGVGLSMFGLGTAQTAAMATGNEDEARGLARLNRDIQETTGSFGVEFSGGTLQRSVRGAGVSVGMMAPALALGPAGRLAGIQAGAAETAAIGALAPATFALSYNESMQEADALEQQGRLEEAQKIRNRSSIRAVADTVFELGVERINPFFSQVGAAGWARRLPKQVFQEAIVEEPLTMLLQQEVSNPLVDRPASYEQLPEVVLSAAIATTGTQAVTGVVSSMLPKTPQPMASEVTPADVARNVAAAASGMPVQVNPQAIRPQNAGAVTAAAQTNPETLAGVVAMTTNTTPVATPQNAPVAPPTPAPAIDNVDEGFFQQPGKFYRVVVGDEAFEDIVTTGEVRTNASSKVKEGASLMERLAARPTAFPSFSKDSAAMLYARDNPNHYIIVSDDASIQPSQSGRHSKGKTYFPTDEQGNHLESLSGKKVRVYKPMGNGRYQLVYDQGRLVSQANPQAAPQPSPEVVAGVEELTDEEARAIDAELGINPDLGTGEFSERDAMRIIGQEPITPPTAAEQPQTQQANEIQDTLQDQEQIGPQEADAQANAQTQEGLLAPTVAPSPEGAAISPQPPQPNVQNQIQETGGTPAIQGVPAISQPEGQTQAGTAQRSGQGQEVGTVLPQPTPGSVGAGMADPFIQDDDGFEMLKDAAKLRREQGRPDAAMEDRIARIEAARRGENVQAGQTFSNVVVGHPQFEPPHPELRNLIPIYTRSQDEAQAKFDIAYKLLMDVKERIGTATRAVMSAKTPAQKKAAEKKFPSSELARLKDVADYLQNETLPELDRLINATPATPQETKAPSAAQPATAPQEEVVRDATKPEQMTPEERGLLGHQEVIELAKQDYELAKTGQTWGYSGGQNYKSKAAAVKDTKDRLAKVSNPTESDIKRGASDHYGEVNKALEAQNPVSSAAVEAYGITLPEGYVKQGDLYVFQPGETGATPVQAAPTAQPATKEPTEPQPAAAIVELTDLPLYFQRNPNQKKLWNVDETYAEPAKPANPVGDEAGSRGTAFTVEQLMYQIATLREAVSSMNGRLLRGGDKGASSKQLAENWTTLRGYEALAAEYAKKNPDEWQAYMSRQDELFGLEAGADVLVPYPSPDTAPLGNIGKLDKKFAKNWRVTLQGGGTVLLHPTALRPVPRAATPVTIEEAPPQTPPSATQPAATQAATAPQEEVVRDATKPEQMTPEEFASSANQPWNLAPEDETSYMTRGGAVSVGNTIQKLGAGKDVGTFRGHQVKTETAWNSDESTGRFVIEDGGKVVASIKLNRDRTVEHLAVSPEYRASGMANALLDAADQFGGIDLVGTKDKSRLGGIAMHRWAINKAIANKEPISVAAVEQYQMPRPIGYKQQGEMFVPVQESGRSPALQNAEQRATVAAQETGNSPEVELQAIIETPQYGQEWLQEQVQQARAEGVQAGDTVVAQDEAGETIIGTVAATTDESTTVSTTSGDVTVPTAGLVRQAPQSLSRKPGLAQALMESDGAALQLGISQQDVERGIAATRRQIPGASNIWSGTRQAFLDTFGNDPAVQDMVQQLEEGVMTEGFYVPSLQRGFLFTDSVVVYQGDADRAALNGTTPAVEAAKRLIRHEVGGHGGWMTLTQKQQQQFMDIARDVIPVSDMNQMIEDGYPFQDWQTDEEVYRQAAEEWFSQRIGRMDKLPETGPMARFVDWLKGVWRWLTGRKGDPDLDAIKNLWRQIRMNQAAMATGRAWYSLPRQGAARQVNDARDAEYLAAVEAGDMEKAQRMVDSIRLKPREVFYVGRAEVIRNPSDSDYRQIKKEHQEEYPNDRMGETTRFTTDKNGNRYIWRADYGMHSMVEPGIEARENVTVGQNEFNWNMENGNPVIYRDGKPIPLSQRFPDALTATRYSRVRSNAELLARTKEVSFIPMEPETASEQIDVRDSIYAAFRGDPDIERIAKETMNYLPMKARHVAEAALSMWNELTADVRDPSVKSEMTPEEAVANAKTPEEVALAEADHRDAITQAINFSQPVSAEAVARYGIAVPDDYALMGALYARFLPNIERAMELVLNPESAAKGGFAHNTPQGLAMIAQAMLAGNHYAMRANPYERNRLKNYQIKLEKLQRGVSTEGGRTLAFIKIFKRTVEATGANVVGALQNLLAQKQEAKIDSVMNVDDTANEVEKISNDSNPLVASELTDEIAALWDRMMRTDDIREAEAIADVLKSLMPRRQNAKRQIASLFPQAGIRDRMNQRGTQLVRNFFQMLAGPRDQSGPLAQFDDSIQSALSEMLRKVVKDAGLLSQNESNQPDAVDKIVRSLSSDPLRFDKIEAADALMQQELDAIEDVERREVLRQAWEEATASMRTNIANPAWTRRAVNDALAGAKVAKKDWKAAFDTGTPRAQALAAIRQKAIDDTIRAIESRLTDPGDTTVQRNLAMVRQEVGEAFDQIAEVKYASWLRDRARAAEQKRLAAMRASIVAALRKQKMAQDTVDKLEAAMAGTPATAKKNAPNPLRDLIDSHSRLEVPDFIEQAVAAGLATDDATRLRDAITRYRNSRYLAPDSPLLSVLFNQIKNKVAGDIGWADLISVDKMDGQRRQEEIFKRIRNHDALKGLDVKQQVALTNALNRLWLKKKQEVMKRELQKLGLSKGGRDPRVAEMFEKVADRSMDLVEFRAKAKAVVPVARWNSFNKQIADTWRKIRSGAMTPDQLDELIGKPRKIMEVDVRNIIDSTSEILRYMNLGMWSAEALRDSISEKYGVKSLNSKEAKEIEDLARQAYNAEPGLPRDKLLVEIMRRMADFEDVSLIQLFQSYRIADLLFSARTFMAAGLTILNSARKLLGLATYQTLAATMGGSPQRAEASWVATKKFFQAMPEAATNALAFLTTGDFSLLPSITRDLDDAFKSGRFGYSAVQMAQNEKIIKGLKQLPRRIKDAVKEGEVTTAIRDVMMSSFVLSIVSVQRIMGAIDLFVGTVSRESVTPLVAALNPDIFDLKKVLAEQRPEAYRKAYEQAQRELFGRPAKSIKEKAEASTRAREYIARIFDPYLLEEADAFAAETTYQVNPTGVGGLMYSIVQSGVQKLSAMTKQMQTDLDNKLAREEMSAIERESRKLAVAAMRFIAEGAPTDLGVRFIRFTGNRVNELISLTPVLGLLRLKEASIQQSQIKKATLAADQAFASAFALFAIAFIMEEWDDEKTDEERGWYIEGPWNGLTPAEKDAAFASGKKPYTFAVRVGGKWLQFNYREWQTAGLFTTLGAMMDRKRYQREAWEEQGIAGAAISGIALGLLSFKDMSSMSQMMTLAGNNPYERDPVQGSQDAFGKFAGGYASSMFPTFVRDVDYMMNPEHRKAEFWHEQAVMRIPFGRLYAGQPDYDFFMEPVLIDRGPLSRVVSERTQDPARIALGKLNTADINATAPNLESRIVGRGMDARPMTTSEKVRFQQRWNREIKRYLVTNTDRLLRMKRDEAQEKIRDDINDIKQEIEDAVAP